MPLDDSTATLPAEPPAPVLTRAPLGQPPRDPFAAPSTSETVDAAFRQGHPIASVISAIQGGSPSTAYDPNHNPLDLIRGTKYEAEHLSNFASSPNEATTRSIMARIDKEDDDRKTLAASGWGGTVASLAVGLIDPTMYLPFVGMAERGAGALAAARRMAMLGALQSSVSEAALQASQQTRTFGESAGNVATGTLLMGILGAGAHALMSPAERVAATEGLDTARHAITTGEAPAAAANENAPFFGPGQAQAAGAAASDVREMKLKPFIPIPQAVKDLPIIGSAFEAFGNLNTKFSPTLRGFSNPSLAARRFWGDAADTPLRFSEGEKGVTPSFGGPPVDLSVKQQINGLTIKTHDTLRDLFLDYRYGENQPAMAFQRAGIDDLRGASGGKMSYGEFKTEVAQALWSGDQHAIPQVQQAAQELRQKVLDPVKGWAQETMGPDGQPMLGEELAPPKGDQSHYPRQWRTSVVEARRTDLKGTITDWLGGEQTQKAATKERLEGLSDQHGKLSDQIGKLEGRLGTLEQRQTETGARADEASMAAGQAGARTDTVAARQTEIKEALSEVEEFISTMRGEARDPAALERLRDLEKEASALRREAAPMSQAEQSRIEKEEVGDVLPGDIRKAAEVFLGRRKAPKPKSILAHIVKEGGINDIGGDVSSIIGGAKARPGLINSAGRDADAWGELFGEMSPHSFEGGRPTAGQVLEIIDEAAHGREPSWWLEASGDKTQHIREMATAFDEALGGADKPRTLAGVARAIKEDQGRIPAVLKRLQEKVEAGRDLEGATQDIEGQRAALQQLRDFVERAQKDRGRLTQREAVAGARVGEAGVAETRASGRAKLLQGRLDRQGLMRDLLEAAHVNAEDARAKVRGKIEEEIRGWKGDSSADAIRALKVRDEAERVRGLKQQAGIEVKGGRLASADHPVDRAVKRILESDRDLPRSELADRADEIIDRIVGSPDGRIPYDIASGGPAIGPMNAKQQVRGSLNRRDFAIPTSLIKDFVETDVEHAIAAHLRTVVPDIALTRRFGDVEATDVMRRVNEDYARLADAAKSEKESRKVADMRKATIRDIAAQRDRIRGVYGWSPDPRMRNAARYARAFGNVNSLAGLGTSVANRQQDLVNTVARYGFMNVMRDAYRPFLKGMLGMSALPKAMRGQAKAMAVGVDGMMGHMRTQFADVTENYRPGSKFERGLAWATDRSMLVNLHGPWTDWMKTLATSAASQDFLRDAKAIAGGALDPKALARMAGASIDPHMAARIWTAFTEDGGEAIDGVHLPNTGDWKDAGARQAFEHAMLHEANISVVTPGAERPLWMSNPIVGLIGQFKSFIAGAHERILLSNLQQRDGRTLQGFFALIGAGLLSYRLYTLVAGQTASDKPQDWIKEAVHRSAITGWFSELNAMQSRLLGGSTDAFRAIGAGRPLSNRVDRSGLSELLGPTWSHLEAMKNAGSDAMRGTWSASDSHKLREVLPLQNLWAFRRLLDEAEDGIANAFGIKPRARPGEHAAP